jgi:transposase IS66 family protein
VLEAGLQVSHYLQTDDTGARHDGKNGYCTYIGNELFAWFESTQSKSRVNFLSLLRAGHQDYMLNAGALAYMAQHKLPQVKLNLLQEGRGFADKQAWEEYLKSVGISAPRHRLIATEGALVGSLLARGFPVAMGIASRRCRAVQRVPPCPVLDSRAKRNLNQLVPLNDTHARQIAWVRCQIWDLYADLKAYKTDPGLQNPTFQNEIRQRFKELCRTRTAYQTLNGHLKRLLASQDELLRVLEDPRLPLHNNLSESDIREYVKRRKISGSTRSDDGRRCRDTFTSLKKTCRKLGLSFWQYLRDRVSRSSTIAPLSEAVRAAAAGT